MSERLVKVNRGMLRVCLDFLFALQMTKIRPSFVTKILM